MSKIITMENRFEKYLMFKSKRGKIIGVNLKAMKLVDEAFQYFKDLYDSHYGTIREDDNLISIHTGGWSENEELIEEFRGTAWWFKYHKITKVGGHYYFDNDFRSEKKWQINNTQREIPATQPTLKQSELNRLAEIGSNFIIKDRAGKTRLTGVGVAAILRAYLKPKK